MTQKASAESIVAPFDGRTLTQGGVTSRVERRGENFWVTTPDPDIEFALANQGNPTSAPTPPMVARQVVMTTGSHHMQIYWLPSQRSSELRIFPWVYFIDGQRWMPFEDSFVAPPTLGRMRVSWNTLCIVCHAVDGRPTFDRTRNRFQTEVAEFGIACEACHGPGEPHIRWHESGLATEERGPDPIVHPGKLSAVASAQVCGQCHSDFTRDNDYWVQGPRYRAGHDLDQAQKMVRFEDRMDPTHSFHGSYWEDGTARTGGREYPGMIVSQCYLKGELTCLTCHSMHHAESNQQLTDSAQSNEVCLSCHSALREDLQQHTHHAPDSQGSLCYNCHMPRTSYALFRAMRSHRIDIPNVTSSVTSGRPNACNLCHLDQSLAWTSKHLTEWFDIPSADLNDEQNKVAASAIWMLRGDAGQRIVTAWHVGWRPAQEASGDDWQAPLLAELLDDSYSAVRFVASRSLEKIPGFMELDYDFLAPSPKRIKAKETVLELWHSKVHPSRQRPTAVLQTPEGQYDQAAANGLLKRQDRRPITFPE